VQVAFSGIQVACFYGLICLLYISIFQSYKFDHHAYYNYISYMLTSVLMSLGIVFINIACNVGNPGLANAILQNSTIVTIIITFLIFDQPINFMQFLGILLAVGGGITISIADKIHNKGKK
jgi:drug/metabolite transporter (DMT)-like permease